MNKLDQKPTLPTLAEAAARAKALLEVFEAVVDAIDDCGQTGMPSGVLYAHLMTKGCTLPQFEHMMEILVASGRIRKVGHVFFGPSHTK